MKAGWKVRNSSFLQRTVIFDYVSERTNVFVEVSQRVNPFNLKWEIYCFLELLAKLC